MPTVRVQLINAATNQLLGEAELPVEQLPESFAVATTLHLGGEDWHVEHADPVTRADYVATGQLRLVLRKIERIDPQKILFSLPTLENALPPLVAGDTEHAVVLHEDDWRQHELVSAHFDPEIAAELADIRKVYESRKGVGFERLHVRERIPEPLRGVTLAFDQLQRTLGEVARRPVALGGQIVEGGFAFVRDDFTCYGRVEGGLVSVLAIAQGDAALLGPLADEHALATVDWCRARRD